VPCSDGIDERIGFLDHAVAFEVASFIFLPVAGMHIFASLLFVNITAPWSFMIKDPQKARAEIWDVQLTYQW